MTTTVAGSPYVPSDAPSDVVTPSGSSYEASYADSREESRAAHQPKREFIPDVPIEVGPDLIDAPNYTDFAEASVFGKAVFGNAQASLTQLHDLYTKMEITEHLLRNETPEGAKKVYVREGYGPGKMITAHGREHEYSKDLTVAYKGVLGRVQSKLDQMENVTHDLLKQIESSTKAPSATSAKDIALATEIRAHMKGLKSADQFEQSVMMHELIKAGDKAYVSAILDAPAFLSGMTAEEQAEYRKDAQETWAPEAVNQLRMTQRLIKHVWHARDILSARYHVSQARMSHTDAATFSRHLSELRGMA